MASLKIATIKAGTMQGLLIVADCVIAAKARPISQTQNHCKGLTIAKGYDIGAMIRKIEKHKTAIDKHRLILYHVRVLIYSAY